MSEQAATNRIQGLWQAAIRPHPSITDRGERRRASILAGLCLLLTLLGMSALIIAQIMVTQVPVYDWLTFVLPLIAYILARTRWPVIGAVLMTYGQMAAYLAIIFSAESSSLAPQFIMFILLPVLLSMLVLMARYTIGLAALAIAGVGIFALVAPGVTIGTIVMPIVIIALVSALASAAAVIRERDIATLETQSDSIDEYSQDLQEDMERLTLISNVGRAITAMRDLDTLLKEVVSLVVQRLDYYHAQVFLVDEAGQYATLRASTGEVGQQLLARGHRLEVGSQSVIGQVTARADTIIASDTDADPVHRRNELLPRTRSEMALPLRVGGRVIGALDIQSTEPNAFKPSDAEAFQAMADQLAIAIENARLFDQAQRDLRDIEILNRQLTGDAWRQFLAGRSDAAPLGYEADDRGLHPLTAGSAPEASPGGRETVVSVPLSVRGQTIGMLDLKHKEGKTPDLETQNLIEAVAERVALALDSTRLSEQAQLQAEREQILSRLSAELQASTDLDVVLRIAAREASQAMDSPRGFVHLTMEYGERQGPAE